MQESDPTNWSCPECIGKAISQRDTNSEYLTALPFASVENLSHLVEDGVDGIDTTTGHHFDQETADDLSDLVQRLEAGTNKDVRLAHSNVCSLKGKIEELRCLQLLCKFEILAITETHLDKSISDTEINIPEMKFIRLDRNGRRGGGYVLYYAGHLRAFYRKDLFTSGVEAAWLQVNFPSSSVLFSVIYRPPDTSQFFDLIGPPLEKAWLKTSNIVLLGDFNCDFKLWNGDCRLSTNAEKLRSIFEMFNMQNVVMENTRVTQTSCSLLDLIATTRKDLISTSGAFPLGISDHNLVYATMRLKNKDRHLKMLRQGITRN